MARLFRASPLRFAFVVSLLALVVQLFGAELLFDASFDKGTAADSAKGDAAPYATSDTAAALADGLHGKAVRIGTWKELMTPGTTDVKDRAYHWQYHAQGNIDYRKGAVSFWVAPGDWEGNSSTENKMLFHAACDDDAALFLFKPSPDGRIIFYLKNYASTVQTVLCPVDDWRKGEWHHIVYNWTDGHADFFVDGESAASLDFLPFQKEFLCFNLGNVGFSNEIGGSLMDDFRIYDAPLTEAEIGELYQSANSDKPAVLEPMIGVGKNKKPPVLDGVVNDGEYSVNVAGFLEYGTARPCESDAMYGMAHDGERLYIAVKSTLPEGYQEKSYGRDANLWEDEGIEVHLDVPGGKQYQFILNPLGNIFDSCEKDSAWNADSLQVVCSVESGIWQCECAVSLAELGISDHFGINIARSYQSPARLTCIANVRPAIGYADPERYLQARLLPSAAPAVALSSLSLEDDLLLLTARGLTPGKVNASVAFSTKTAVLARHDFTLNSSEKTVVQTNPPDQAFAEVKFTMPDGSVIYQNTFDVSKSAKPSISLKYIYTDMDTDTVKFVLHRLSRHLLGERIRIDFSTLDGKPARSKTIELGDSDGMLTLDFEAAGLPAGFYDVIGTHLSGQQEKVVFREAWRMPDKHAIPDYFAPENLRVQPPWTEVTTHDDTVNCLGREYRFNGNLLLQSMTSQEKELLTDGMALVIDGAKAEAEEPATPRVENHGAYCFVHQDAKYGALSVSTECRVDYDGLVKVKMRLEPPAEGLALKSLQVAIPCDAEIAEFVNAGMGYGKGAGQSRAFGPDGSWNCNLYSALMFWLGDSDVGLSLAFKNLRGWHCKDAVNSVVVKSDERTRTVYLNLVDTPFLLKEPRTIEFALMATPAKTTSPKVLRTRFCEWNMWSDRFSAYFDYPELPYLVDKTNADNAFHYNSFGTSPHSPDWNYYHRLWHTGVMGAIREDFHIEDDLENLKLRNRDQYVFGCFDSPTFLDFKIREMEFVLNHKPFNTQNLYFDLVIGLTCASADHGCAWTDDFGRTWGSMDWEGRRIYLQHAREMLLKKNPKGLISLHSHCQRTLVNAYGDIQVGGEDFVGEVGMKGNYYGIVNSEVLRAHSNAFGYGMKKIFIPQFERSLLFVKPGETFDFNNPDNIKAVRHLLTMLLAHDIDPWAPGNPIAQSIWALEKDFGWDEQTAFAPMWRTDGLYSIERDDSNGALIVGMFHRPGRALLAVVNDSDADNVVRIRVNAKLFSKGKPMSVQPFFQPERTTRLSGDMLEIPLAPREAEILWLEGK